MDPDSSDNSSLTRHFIWNFYCWWVILTAGVLLEISSWNAESSEIVARIFHFYSISFWILYCWNSVEQICNDANFVDTRRWCNILLIYEKVTYSNDLLRPDQKLPASKAKSQTKIIGRTPTVDLVEFAWISSNFWVFAHNFRQ